MRVTRLSIDKYRNLSDIELVPAEGVNVIFGENGQGKTNILESIWLFSGAKSFRGSSFSEMLPLFEEQKRADFTLCHHDGVRETQTRIILGEKREIRQNGVNLDSFSDLCGGFCCVVFSPAHLNLIKGGPAERRKAIDTVIGQIKPRYISLLQDYQKLLLQRNTLLKDIKFSSSLIDTLDVWDISLAKTGAMIAKTRESFVNKLIPLCKEVYDGISGGKESYDMSYSSTVSADNEISQQVMLEMLKSSRGEDIQNGSTSIGPHRDDIIIEINGISARSFGSQGQQRSGVLALKLGECALMQEVTGHAPVILLDDVMSELDDNRRDFLLHRLEDRQIFITCCDPNQIVDVDAKFEVQKGKII